MPLFAASGIFSAMTPEHREGLDRLRRKAAGSHGVFQARDFLSRADLRGLHSEARSLVDFLVIMRCQVRPEPWALSGQVHSARCRSRSQIRHFIATELSPNCSPSPPSLPPQNMWASTRQ